MGVISFSCPPGRLLRSRGLFRSQVVAEVSATVEYFSSFPETSAARRQIAYVSRFNERYSDMAALTVGCGAKSLLSVGISYGVPETLLARNYGVKVVGTDYRIGKTQEYAARVVSEGVQVELWDIGQAPLNLRDKFDMVWCCEVLEHLRINPVLVIPELCEAVNSGGHILITVPNACSMHNVTQLLKGRTFVEPLAICSRAEHAQGRTVFDSWIHVREPGIKDVGDWLRDYSPSEWTWHIWMPRPSVCFRGRNLKGSIGHCIELGLKAFRPTIYALGCHNPTPAHRNLSRNTGSGG